MLKNLLFLVITTIALLLIPLIAMQWTSDVNWTAADFFIMGAMIVGFGSVLVVYMEVARSRKQKILFTVIMLILFALIWAELSVGIFGTPFAGH